MAKTRASVVKIPGAWRYRAQQHRTYWRARALGARALFSLRAGLFRAVTRFRSTGESAAIIFGLGKLIAFGGITAVGLIALLAMSERLLLAQAGPVPEDISKWLHAIVSNTNFEALDSLLLTLLQVAGLFLGLYFTAVSVVASTVYARVQTDIRGLLRREKIGNFYLKIIVLVGTMSLLILGASAAGHHPGVLAAALTALLGILALLSFIPLGYRIFRFFDPTVLIELYVVREIADWIQKASPEGFAWRDRSFQTHYQKEAESRLETYMNIVRFAITRLGRDH